MKFPPLVVGCLLAGLISHAGAVIFLETDDPSHNTTTPGDNSGWQYEGKFGAFLGVPIAPSFFITAKHIGGGIGDVFDFHGDSYTVIASHPSPTTDLQIWEVDPSKSFPVYAPLASAAGDTGTTATVMGRGTRRGIAVTVDEVLKGWQWGLADHVQRWGRNVVEGVHAGGTGIGELLFSKFNFQGLPDECHLSVGDSGGGMFVLENGLWRLAGIHYAVEGPFRHDSSETPFHAALFDTGGLEAQDPGWMLVPDGDNDVPSGFFSSRISSSLAWIRSVTGHDGSLPEENYHAWQRLYFTPAQIATPAATGPLGDYDNDGIGNLVEFALNLDPVFNELADMVANTGLRGLPLVRVESIFGADHVTIEFVRRTAASGSGLTYEPRFSSDMDNWDTVGMAGAVAINERWERVKIVDSLTTNATARRFVRLDVTLSE